MSIISREDIYFEDFDGLAIAAALHNADSDAAMRVVVMAHGFHGNKAGGSRHFVDLARDLAHEGISTFRFDQPGSGDSAGSFEDASFKTWISTIEHFARRFKNAGYAVALLGESMGGNATMAAAARLGSNIRGIVLWCPDPASAKDPPPAEGWMEEAGQRVRWDYWREATESDFLADYTRATAPTYMVFGTADHHVSIGAIRRMESQCKAGDVVQAVEGLPHSAWPVQDRDVILGQTVEFLVTAFGS